MGDGGARVIAILETMWDWRGMTSEAGYEEAPRYFRINRKNRSGGRLYRLIGDNARLLVTNACRELGRSAKYHGKGDPIWLGENLRLLDGVGGVLPGGGLAPDSKWRIDVLLVCGRVAQRTFQDCDYQPKNAQIIEMPHPAARQWTKEKLATTSSQIQTAMNIRSGEG